MKNIMKRVLFSIILVFILKYSYSQKPLDSEIALVAKNLTSNSYFKPVGSKGEQFSLKKIDSIVFQNETIGYLVSYQPEGFVLIPNFKEINPYFAFSNEGKISADTNNYVYSFLMKELILRSIAIKENKMPDENIEKNRQQWKEKLLNSVEKGSTVQIPAAGTTSSGGWITTNWGQTGIYNAYCPIDPNTHLRSLSGCVATAMAQVINYWGNLSQTPKDITFSALNNYSCANGINIDATSASMQNISYPLTVENIGRLMYACGVSAYMNYSSSSSSASIFWAQKALLERFGFTTADLVMYDQSLTGILYKNIQNRLPSLLSIYNTQYSHLIICDGVIDDGQTLKFHLNYGWDGQFGGPTFFYEIPSALPSGFTNIGAAIVEISKGIFDTENIFYKSGKIGSQIWIMENLKSSLLNDNTAIPNITDNTAWSNTVNPGYCWYTNELANKNIYGALYNWNAVNSNKLCPIGWHVPSEADWNTLVSNLGGNEIAGATLKEAGYLHWTNPNTSATNSSGFTSLPGGDRNSDGTFANMGNSSSYWSSTEYNSLNSWNFNLSYLNDDVLQLFQNKALGKSVRCIKSQSPTVTTLSIEDITITSAKSGGNVSFDGGDLVTARGICWSTNPNPTVSLSSKTNDGSGSGSFISSITGLIAGTRYFVRAYATNNCGTSYGQELSLITKNTNAIVDGDGNYYPVIQIGTQSWITENLKTKSYNDHTLIPNVIDNTTWNNLTSPGYCWYNNDEVTYKNVYGALYNWYAVNSGKLCPAGWHVPSNADFMTLLNFLGDPATAGGKLKETGYVHWESPNIGATNSSGFTALPGGQRNEYFGGFGVIRILGTWWLSSSYDISTSLKWYCDNYYADVMYGPFAGRAVHQDGYSVRCLQNTFPMSNHFFPLWQPGNGMDHMNFSVKLAVVEGSDLQPGDEIGIFDGEVCVGVGILTSVLSGNNNLEIKASLDDPATEVKDGYISGNPIHYRIWSSATNREFKCIHANYIQGPSVFTKNSSTTIEFNGSVEIPSAPIIEEIIQPTDLIQTGSVKLSGLPEIGIWSLKRSPDNAIITGIGQNITISQLPVGIYSFSVTSSTGCSSNYSAEIVIDAIITSLKNESFKSMGLFPNPAGTFTNLILGNEFFSAITISVMDINGKIISVQKNNNLISGKIIRLDLTNLTTGIYLIKVEDNIHKKTFKLNKF
jgi:uncharacterized protein (TIGR02145 family)